MRGPARAGDYCSGEIWTGTMQNGTWSQAQLLGPNATLTPVAFGEDAAGELYVVHYPSSGSGAVYRIESGGGL